MASADSFLQKTITAIIGRRPNTGDNSAETSETSLLSSETPSMPFEIDDDFSLESSRYDARRKSSRPKSSMTRSTSSPTYSTSSTSTMTSSTMSMAGSVASAISRTSSRKKGPKRISSRSKSHSAVLRVKDEDLPDCAVKIYPADDEALHFYISKPPETSEEDPLSDDGSTRAEGPGGFYLNSGRPASSNISSNMSIMSSHSFRSTNSFSSASGYNARPSTAMSCASMDTDCGQSIGGSFSFANSSGPRSVVTDKTHCRCFVTLKHPGKTDHAIAYKIKTTQPHRYRIHPTHQGILRPGESEIITVRLLNKYKYSLMAQYQSQLMRKRSSASKESSKSNIEIVHSKSNGDYFFVQSIKVKENFAKVYCAIKSKLPEHTPDEMASKPPSPEVAAIRSRMAKALQQLWATVKANNADGVVPMYKQKIQARHSIISSVASGNNAQVDEPSYAIDDLEIFPVHLLRFPKRDVILNATTSISSKKSKASLTLKHCEKSRHYVAYKILSSNPSYYKILPRHQGILAPPSKSTRRSIAKISIAFLEKYRTRARIDQADERFIVQSCAVTDDFAKVYNVIQEKIKKGSMKGRKGKRKTISEEEVFDEEESIVPDEDQIKAYHERLSKVLDAMWKASADKIFEKEIRVTYE